MSGTRITKVKFYILGCTGMAGHIIGLHLLEKDHEVYGYSRHPTKLMRNVNFSIFDQNNLTDSIEKIDPDVIVNCIGILNKYAEENKEEAVYLNSYLPHFLVKQTRHTKTKVFHLSTDCVFSGSKGQYKDKDFPDGKTFYDRSKALGEILDEKNLTFRNSIVGPDISPNGIGLFNWFMSQKKTISGYKGSLWSGITTLTLAKAIEKAAEVNLTGLYQLSNNQNISKFNLCCLFNKYFRNGKVEIEPVQGIIQDKTLLRSEKPFDFEVPSYEQMIIEMSEWVNKHKSLYKHYE